MSANQKPEQSGKGSAKQHKNGTAWGGVMYGLTIKLNYFWMDTHWNIKLTVSFIVPSDFFRPQCSRRVGVLLSRHVKSPDKWNLKLETMLLMSANYLLLLLVIKLHKQTSHTQKMTSKWRDKPKTLVFCAHGNSKAEFSDCLCLIVERVFPNLHFFVT